MSFSNNQRVWGFGSGGLGFRIGEQPKFFDEGDEYVELSGEVKNVRDALIQIVLRLRDDALKDKDGASNPSAGPDPLYAGSSGLSLPPVFNPLVNPLGYEPRHDSGSGVGMLSSGGHYKYGSLSMGDDGYGSSYSSKHYGGLMSSSTLELYIPVNAVSKVLGKNGSNLSNLRQVCIKVTARLVSERRFRRLCERSKKTGQCAITHSSQSHNHSLTHLVHSH